VTRARPVDKQIQIHATALSPAYSRATILVVEDEILVRAELADELREHGYTVVETANADEALLVLHSNVRVDLLITDIRMPGSLNGMGLARLVRAEYPFVKVVLASGQMPDAAVGEMIDGFFPKPYDFPKVMGQIKALLA
jgi:two-component system, response regulator PdtaR